MDRNNSIGDFSDNNQGSVPFRSKSLKWCSCAYRAQLALQLIGLLLIINCTCIYGVLVGLAAVKKVPGTHPNRAAASQAF